MTGWALGSLGLRGNSAALTFLGRVLGPLPGLRKGFLFLLEVTERCGEKQGQAPGPHPQCETRTCVLPPNPGGGGQGTGAR